MFVRVGLRTIKRDILPVPKRLTQLKYGLVWGLFLLGSFSSTPERFLLVGFLSLLIAGLLRVNWSALLLLSLPFDFLLVFDFAATVSLAHLVLPLALIQEFRALLRGQTIRDKVPLALLYFVTWGGLLLAGIFASLVGKEIIGQSFLSAAAKFSVSMLFGLLAVLVIVNRYRKAQQLLLLAKVWTLGALSQIALATIGLVTSWFVAEPLWVYSTHRMLGTFNNPNSFAGFLLVALGIAIASSSNRPTRKSYLVVVIMTLGIWGVDSLAAQVAIVVVGSTGLVLSAVGRDGRALLALSSLIASLFALPARLFLLPYLILAQQHQVTGRLGSLERPGVLQVGVGEALVPLQDVRWSLWQEAVPMFLGSPWFGVGFGQFLNLNSFGLDAHNSHLQLLVEAGVFTYILFLSGFLFHYVRSLKIAGPGIAISNWHFGLLIFGLGNAVVNSPSFWLLTGALFALALRPLWPDSDARGRR